MNLEPSATTPVYQLSLKKNRVKSYRLLAILVGYVHLIIFCVLIFSRNNAFVKIVAGCGIGALVFFLLIKGMEIFKRFSWLSSLNCMYVSMCIVWVLFGYYWMVPVLLLIVIMNTLSGRTAIVSFFKDRIQYPSIPKKIIDWNELSNVVLKDQLLSIDFSNDKLIQAEVDVEVDEVKFNEFTSTRIQNQATSI